MRVLCEDCKTEDKTARAVALGQRVEALRGAKIYRADGCKNCRMTGFTGRRAIFELMTMSGPIREILLRGGSSVEIKDATADDTVQTPEREHIFTNAPIYGTPNFPDQVLFGSGGVNAPLEAAVAHALGIPMTHPTNGAPGTPARPILASQLAELTQLNLAGFNLFIGDTSALA